MDFRGIAADIVIIFNLLVLFYFAAINTIYLVLFGAAFVQSIRHRRRRRLVDLYEVFRSSLNPSISVLVPAFNEEATICESVHSVLHLRYPNFEVVVINDGSSDRTMEVLTEKYDLRRISKAVEMRVPCEEIRGVYISSVVDNLVVVDKHNGGKANALNAGINVTRNDLICSIDADSIIEPEGLLKVARPFIENPGETQAVGGLVRIINGCKVVGGSVTEVGLPGGYWANMQIVEYLRAFMGGRSGWSALRSLLIISGAFGLFNRELVLAVGGYRRETVGEDIDLVVRMHRHLRHQKKKYRMYFVPDPVCWTEAPERWSLLARQRDRWQRGLIETMSTNMRMLFNPRYGVIGMFAMPYFFFFEMLGPFVELFGYFVVILALWLGYINKEFFYLFLSLAFIYSMVVSLFAVMLEGITLQRYPRIMSLLRLTLFAVLENLGYRQLNAWWRTKAFFTCFTRKSKWGAMEHRGLAAWEAAEVKRRARFKRYRWLAVPLVIILLATVVTLPLYLRGRKEQGNFLGVLPSVVEVDGAGMLARTGERQFQVFLEGDWRDFTVKGFNIGTALPGRWFSEFPADPELYRQWFENIAATNANTIRVYTLLDPDFYRTLDEFNRSSRRKLMLFQEIWPDDVAQGDNIFDKDYVEKYRAEIALDIDALMGKADIPRRDGRAWGDYSVNVSPYLLGIIIGREITWEEASTTNAVNDGMSPHRGLHVSSAEDASPVETWVAEMCDFTMDYFEREHRWRSPVGFVSWPTLDPMTHPTELGPGARKEDEQEDSEVLEPANIVPAPGAGLFGCYHIYPYYPDFMNREPAFTESRDEKGVLRYGGYLSQFIEAHPAYPALVGEFGLSTSLGIAHLNAEGFHHGGLNERDQGSKTARMMRAILAKGYAGGLVFEWADEWAKRTWVDMAYMIPFERHIFWHNLMDPEQNFGIMAYEPIHVPFSGSETVLWGETDGRSSEVLSGLSVDHNEAFLYLEVTFADDTARLLVPGADPGEHSAELLIGIDTFGDNNGTLRLPMEGLPELPTGVEFLLRVSTADGAALQARPDYNRGQSRFSAAPAADPEFVDIEFPVNREQVSAEDGTHFPEEFTNDSALRYGDYNPDSEKYDSLAHWYVDEEKNRLFVRLPWLLLNVSDPSSKTVLYDEREGLPPGPAALRVDFGLDALGTVETEGFRFYVALNHSEEAVDFRPREGAGFRQDIARYRWPGWEQPGYRERIKQSYPEIKRQFGAIE